MPLKNTTQNAARQSVRQKNIDNSPTDKVNSTSTVSALKDPPPQQLHPGQTNIPIPGSPSSSSSSSSSSYASSLCRPPDTSPSTISPTNTSPIHKAVNSNSTNRHLIISILLWMNSLSWEESKKKD
jgi:hypothetical protein